MVSRTSFGAFRKCPWRSCEPEDTTHLRCQPRPRPRATALVSASARMTGPVLHAGELREDARALACWKIMRVKHRLRGSGPHHLVRDDTRNAPREQRHIASRSNLRWKLFSRTDLRPVRENNFPSRQGHPARARRGTQVASDTDALVVEAAMGTDVRHDLRTLPPGPAGARARARACHGTKQRMGKQRWQKNAGLFEPLRTRFLRSLLG